MIVFESVRYFFWPLYGEWFGRRQVRKNEQNIRNLYQMARGDSGLGYCGKLAEEQAHLRFALVTIFMRHDSGIYLGALGTDRMDVFMQLLYKIISKGSTLPESFMKWLHLDRSRSEGNSPQKKKKKKKP